MPLPSAPLLLSFAQDSVSDLVWTEGPRHKSKPGEHPANMAWSGRAPSRFGAFEVYVVTNLADDKRVPAVASVHSKLWSRRFPNLRKLTARCQDVLAPLLADYALRAVVKREPCKAEVLRAALEKYGPAAQGSPAEQEARNLLEAVENGDAVSFRVAIEEHLHTCRIAKEET